MRRAKRASQGSKIRSIERFPGRKRGKEKRNGEQRERKQGRKERKGKETPGGNLSFQDTGWCHSNRKSTTHKSGEISQKYTHISGEFSENHTHKSGICKQLLKTIPINPESIMKGTLKNGTTPYHGQVKLPPPPQEIKVKR